MTKKFFRTAMIGAVVYVLPLTAVIFIAGKVFGFIRRLSEPIARISPIDSVLGIGAQTLLTVILLLLICFLFGLLVSSSGKHKFIKYIEQHLNIVPGYALLRNWANSAIELDESDNLPVILANIEDAWQFAFLMETLENGQHAVFIPQSPSIFSGDLFFLPEERIRRVPVRFQQAVKCVRRSGLGARELLKGVK